MTETWQPAADITPDLRMEGWRLGPAPSQPVEWACVGLLLRGVVPANVCGLELPLWMERKNGVCYLWVPWRFKQLVSELTRGPRGEIGEWDTVRFLGECVAAGWTAEALTLWLRESPVSIYQAQERAR